MTNLLYTLVQIVHNFGAAALVGSPIVAYWFARCDVIAQRRLAWLFVIGAIAQISSGVGFGLTSYFLKGELPEIEGVAFSALLVKIFCVTASLAIIVFYVLRTGQVNQKQELAWAAAGILASTALTAAAYLRWYL